MSKIVYILGAGASYGERKKTSEGVTIDGAIIRGVPLVNEIPESISYLLKDLDGGAFESNELYKAISTEKEILKELLVWLKNICKEYQIIDTYAKLLFLTGRNSEYVKLKKALVLFFTLIQSFQKRDLRYDTFLASLLKESIQFPDDITILSWNYDYQMEFAFSNYIEDSQRTIHKIWRGLNLLTKNQDIINSKDISSFIKLNGTASFVKEDKKMFDLFFGDKIQSLLSKLSIFYNAKNANADLYFAWENNTSVSDIQKKVQDAEIVVVIGYSFPDLNRDVDRAIIRSMTALKKIYIQDPVARDIKERFEAVLSEKQLARQEENVLSFVLKQNLHQFVIPNELE